MAHFKQFQDQLVDALRSGSSDLNNEFNVARLEVYKRLVFNNLYALLSTTFSDTKGYLGELGFESLCRDFQISGAAETPLFLHISADFCQWVQHQGHIESAVKQLILYERAIIEVDLEDGFVLPAEVNEAENEFSKVSFSSASRLLSFDYQVHQLAQSDTHDVHPCWLFIYRDLTDIVRVKALNPASFRLLEALYRGQNIAQAVSHIAQETNGEHLAITAFALELLTNLIRDGAGCFENGE